MYSLEISAQTGHDRRSRKGDFLVCCDSFAKVVFLYDGYSTRSVSHVALACCLGKVEDIERPETKWGSGGTVVAYYQAKAGSYSGSNCSRWRSSGSDHLPIEHRS